MATDIKCPQTNNCLGYVNKAICIANTEYSGIFPRGFFFLLLNLPIKTKYTSNITKGH